jgi:hypothetical protein
MNVGNLLCLCQYYCPTLTEQMSLGKSTLQFTDSTSFFEFHKIIQIFSSYLYLTNFVFNGFLVEITNKFMIL